MSFPGRHEGGLESIEGEPSVWYFFFEPPCIDSMPTRISTLE